jgi:hypothetical protein
MLFVKKNAQNQMKVYKGKNQGPASSQNNYNKSGANLAPGSGLELQ